MNKLKISKNILILRIYDLRGLKNPSNKWIYSKDN